MMGQIQNFSHVSQLSLHSNLIMFSAVILFYYCDSTISQDSKSSMALDSEFPAADYFPSSNSIWHLVTGDILTLFKIFHCYYFIL